MPALILNDGTDDVITSSWTARRTKRGTEIAFLWGASQISWFDSATSVYRAEFAIDFDEFCRRVASAGDVMTV